MDNNVHFLFKNTICLMCHAVSTRFVYRREPGRSFTSHNRVVAAAGDGDGVACSGVVVLFLFGEVFNTE